jgi:hypothetical protein
MSASVRPAVVMAVPAVLVAEEAMPQAEREEKPGAVMGEQAAG